jgi:hypothetical protein
LQEHQKQPCEARDSSVGPLTYRKMGERNK